ncbi:glycosyltransferase family 9 protein [Geotalea uraniireducens]|uniref:glycosyltransferase family 9 protein n=1 Tax=Geotalea uraniireducens TaxID=351604 RepID=UPI002490DFC4|nr:glycosyltransferase family 9 protein [Geotalea uraniireducens]
MNEKSQRTFNWQSSPYLLVYTMTAGLGDYFVVGDLTRKAREIVPGATCVVIHRGNPHVKLWPTCDAGTLFFDLYHPLELFSFIHLLRMARNSGAKVFGFQMAPGSLQGYLFYSLIKRIKALDFIVDFNLINADIITPPKGDYILDLHLNQLATIFRKPPHPNPRLKLPIATKCAPLQINSSFVGIHPWTRRNNDRLTWSYDKWLEVVAYLLEHRYRPVLFGRDSQFPVFREKLRREFGDNKIIFRPSGSVKELVETVSELSLLISLNTSTIHASYALQVKTVVLSGPHLDLWTPKNELFREVRDPIAIYPPSDESKTDPGMPMVSRIPTSTVISAIDELLNEGGSCEGS